MELWIELGKIYIYYMRIIYESTLYRQKSDWKKSMRIIWPRIISFRPRRFVYPCVWRRRGVAGHFVSTAFQAESQTPSRQDYDASLPCPPRRKILSRPPTTWKDQLVPEGTKKPTVYPVPLRGPRYRRQTTDSRMDGKMASQIMDPHESGHDTGRNSIQFVRTALRHERLRTVQEHGFAFPLLSSLDGSKVWSAIFFFVSFFR